MKTEKRVAKTGEKIVLTGLTYGFNREGDVLTVDGVDENGIVYVLGKHHVRDTTDDDDKWSYPERHYEVIVDERIYPEPERTEYERNIIALMDQQRKKGLAKYGETLEDNTTLTSVQRLDHASEEGVDKLMYLQHLRKALLDRMTANDYQRAALRTAGIGKDSPVVDLLCKLLPDVERTYIQGQVERHQDFLLLLNGVLGLCGEVGEVADLVKKYVFQGHDLNHAHLVEELGDVHWYGAVASKGAGETLENIMKANVEKLKARYPDGFDKARSINRDENKD